jgi:hypothetical protein
MFRLVKSISVEVMDSVDLLACIKNAALNTQAAFLMPAK